MRPTNLGFVIILAILMGGLVTGVAGCGRGYSDGKRTGTVVKFSRKGVLCKSNEGTMNLGGLSKDGDGNLTATTWEFTVLDQAIADQISAAQASGKRVTLSYVQWVASPFCMDSTYEVVGVE